MVLGFEQVVREGVVLAVQVVIFLFHGLGVESLDAARRDLHIGEGGLDEAQPVRGVDALVPVVVVHAEEQFAGIGGELHARQNRLKVLFLFGEHLGLLPQGASALLLKEHEVVVVAQVLDFGVCGLQDLRLGLDFVLGGGVQVVDVVFQTARDEWRAQDLHELLFVDKSRIGPVLE